MRKKIKIKHTQSQLIVRTRTKRFSLRGQQLPLQQMFFQFFSVSVVVVVFPFSEFCFVIFPFPFAIHGAPSVRTTVKRKFLIRFSVVDVVFIANANKVNLMDFARFASTNFLFSSLRLTTPPSLQSTSRFSHFPLATEHVCV